MAAIYGAQSPSRLCVAHKVKWGRYNTRRNTIELIVEDDLMPVIHKVLTLEIPTIRVFCIAPCMDITERIGHGSETICCLLQGGLEQQDLG